MSGIVHSRRGTSLSAPSDESFFSVSLPGPTYAVASPVNGSGKTSLAVALVQALPGSTAIKFTTVRMDGSRCPKTKGSCACHSLQGEFSIIDHPEVIQQPGTDTARLADAGARQVLWCLAWPGTYPQMLQALLQRLDHGPFVLEGNSVLDFLPEAQVLFVLRPDQSHSKVKRSTIPLLRRAGLVLLNQSTSDDPVQQLPRLPEFLAEHLPQKQVVETNLAIPVPGDQVSRWISRFVQPV